MNRLAGTIPEDAWSADAARSWWDRHWLNEHPELRSGERLAGFRA
jgi:hypothetical protein